MDSTARRVRRVRRMLRGPGLGRITAQQLRRDHAEHHDLARLGHDPVAAPNQPRPRHTLRPEFE